MRQEDDDLRKELEDDVKWAGVNVVILIILFILSFILFSSCKSVEYVPVIEHRTDTCYITKHQRDSILLHDSIHVKEKQQGDTVWLQVERWHTKYIEKATHDTTYIATHDTIPQPYPVEVKVAKPLNWWQRLRMNIGTVALFLIILSVGWEVFKIWRMLHPV